MQMKNRFRTTVHGKITLDIPAEMAPGARILVQVFTRRGNLHASRPFKDFDSANKLYNRLASRLDFQLPTAEHVAG